MFVASGVYFVIYSGPRVLRVQVAGWLRLRILREIFRFLGFYLGGGLASIFRQMGSREDCFQGSFHRIGRIFFGIQGIPYPS